MRENTLVKGVFSLYRTAFGCDCVTTGEEFTFSCVPSGTHFFILPKGRNVMTDYKGMYIDLFKSVTEAVEILKQAQAKSENTYIDTSTADYELMTESELADIVNHKKQS
jgi:hypothetical protein